MDDRTADAAAEFGRRVRLARKEQGLSQEAFAFLAGLDRSYVGQVERGEKNVTLGTIIRLSEALALNPGVLVDALGSSR